VNLERNGVLTIVQKFLGGVKVFQLFVAIEVVEELRASLDDGEGSGIDHHRPKVLLAYQLIDDLKTALRLALDFSKS
jgi:hypothetical protein